MEYFKNLPEPVKMAIYYSIPLILIILGLLNGYIYTGRTFDREIGLCQQEKERYERIVLRSVRDLDDIANTKARAQSKPTAIPLREINPIALEQKLAEDEKTMKEK